MVVRLLHRQQREIGELGSAVAQIDQSAEVPSLGVEHVDTVGFPDEDDRELGGVVVGRPMKPGDTEVLLVDPRDLMSLLRLTVDHLELLSLVFEHNNAVSPDEEVVDHSSGQVGLFVEAHGVVQLSDFEEGNAVVCAEGESVVRVVRIVWQHLHLVDHTQLVKEAVREGFWLSVCLE